MHQKTTINFREMLLWEPKMYRLALQLLGMLGNDLGQPWHVLQCPRHALQGFWHALQGPWPTSACFLQRPRSPTSKRNPLPHLLPYKLSSQESSVPPSFIFIVGT